MANDDDDLRGQDFADDGDVYEEDEVDIIGLGPDTNMNERGGGNPQQRDQNQDQDNPDNQ